MSVPAAWPTVIATLSTIADAGTTDVRVTRGRDTTNEAGDFVMVGVDRIDAGSGWDSAGAFDQQFMTFGGARLETGSINILALSRNGNASAADACTALFALVADLVAAIRADNSLGLAPGTFEQLVAQVQTGTVNESANDEGAMASMPLVVQYQARI